MWRRCHNFNYTNDIQGIMLMIVVGWGMAKRRKTEEMEMTRVLESSSEAGAVPG